MEVTAKSLPTPRLSPKCPREIEMKMESLHTLSLFRETAQLSFLVIILSTQRCLQSYGAFNSSAGGRSGCFDSAVVAICLVMLSNTQLLYKWIVIVPDADG